MTAFSHLVYAYWKTLVCVRGASTILTCSRGVPFSFFILNFIIIIIIFFVYVVCFVYGEYMSIIIIYKLLSFVIMIDCCNFCHVQIFEQASQELRKSDDKAQRKMLLDAWLEFERSTGDEKSTQRVLRMLPRQVKKLREIFNDEGVSTIVDIHV